MSAFRVLVLGVATALFGAALACGGSDIGPTSPTTAAAPRAETGEDVPSSLVALQPVADVTAVAPGQRFTIAASLSIEPGWHIYWRNPGERGLATRVEFTGPRGFEMGEVRFPGPARFGDDVVSYGYADRVLLSTQVTAPDPLPSDTPVTFTVVAEWLACRDSCVRGSDEVELTVPVATATTPSAPANAALFRDHDNRLPKPLGTLFNARHAWSDIDSGAELVIYVDGGTRVEFFPAEDLQNNFSGQALVGGEGVGALHLNFRNPPEAVSGVMLASDGRSTYYFDIDLPGPANE